MTDAIPYRNLPLSLLRAREAVLCHFRPILTQFGLTEPQWRIIRALLDAGELEPREICEICQILSPSLTGVLSRMEETGLVTRKRMAGDQRRLIVGLTEKSRKLAEDLRPLIIRQYKLIEQAYGPELMAELYAVTDRLLQVAQSTAPATVLLSQNPGE